MQSSLSCDDIGFVPQQARAGCLLFRPFFPTSVAEFMGAPEKKATSKFSEAGVNRKPYNS
jgi:hypothetical protein